MATAAQIRANRANAERSTGPRTPQGKARSSQNGRRHGFRSATPSPPPFDDPAFYQLFRGFHTEFLPANPTEYDLVVTLAHTAFQYEQLRRLEDSVWTPPVYDVEIPDRLRRASTYLRYRSPIERKFHHTLRALLRLRKLKTARPNPIPSSQHPAPRTQHPPFARPKPIPPCATLVSHPQCALSASPAAPPATSKTTPSSTPGPKPDSSSTRPPPTHPPPCASNLAASSKWTPAPARSST